MGSVVPDLFMADLPTPPLPVIAIFIDFFLVITLMKANGTIYGLLDGKI
jgi:hypothetical protein